MRQGDRNEIPTISDVVERATALCDPHGTDTAVTGLYEGFEDDSRPATAAADLGGELEETLDAIDPGGASPAAQMAVATAVWLATNFEQADDREHVLREAARLHFHAEPPEPVADWLAAEGAAV